MAKELEFEVKALLNYKSYTRIYRHFNFDYIDPIMQQNFYFDTPERHLTKMLAALRVRIIGNTYMLTLKYIEEDHKIEVTDLIEEQHFNQLIEGKFIDFGEVRDKLIELSIPTEKINFVSSLTTKRYIVSINEGKLSGKLFLDFNMYGDIADYEIEVESTSIEAAKTLMSKILGRLYVPFAFSDISKIERAISVANKV